MRDVDMSADAVTERLQRVGRMSSLGPRQGIWSKVGAEPEAVTARLRTVSRLRDLCLRLGRLGSGSPPRGGLEG